MESAMCLIVWTLDIYPGKFYVTEYNNCDGLIDNGVLKVTVTVFHGKIRIIGIKTDNTLCLVKSWKMYPFLSLGTF